MWSWSSNIGDQDILEHRAQLSMDERAEEVSITVNHGEESDLWSPGEIDYLKGVFVR